VVVPARPAHDARREDEAPASVDPVGFDGTIDARDASQTPDRVRRITDFSRVVLVDWIDLISRTSRRRRSAGKSRGCRPTDSARGGTRSGVARALPLQYNERRRSESEVA
jgi:hypothetical protein